MRMKINAKLSATQKACHLQLQELARGPWHLRDFCHLARDVTKTRNSRDSFCKTRFLFPFPACPQTQNAALAIPMNTEKVALRLKSVRPLSFAHE